MRICVLFSTNVSNPSTNYDIIDTIQKRGTQLSFDVFYVQID